MEGWLLDSLNVSGPTVVWSCELYVWCAPGGVIVPADRIKVQQQVALGKVKEGVLTCAMRLVSKHGFVCGLLSGGIATALRQVPSAAIYFGSYHAYQPHLRQYVGDSSASLVAGGLAGALGYALTYPLDVIKANQQAQVGPVRGVLQTAHDLQRRVGHGWVHRGIWPTLMRAFVINAVNFSVFERLTTEMALRRVGSC